VTTPTAVVKVVGLSPRTTDLLRARTRFQQQTGYIEIGRTIVEFHYATDDVLRLVEHLIATEIPGSGASSKEVKRLRDLRDRIKHPGLEGSGVTITTAVDETRERALDLLADIWWHIDMSGEDYPYQAGSDLTELALGSPHAIASQTELRDWLAEHL